MFEFYEMQACVCANGYFLGVVQHYLQAACVSQHWAKAKQQFTLQHYMYNG